MARRPTCVWTQKASARGEKKNAIPRVRRDEGVRFDGADITRGAAGADEHMAADDAADRILGDLRALRPEMDTFLRVPAATLTRLHMDPEGSAAAIGGSALLAGLPDAGIDAFLAAHRNQQAGRSASAGVFALGAGDVIIVDEAGMVTTPKLAEVVAVVARNGAVVRAIGDDRQLGAIGSGGALRLLFRRDALPVR